MISLALESLPFGSVIYAEFKDAREPARLIRTEEDDGDWYSVDPATDWVWNQDIAAYAVEFIPPLVAPHTQPAAVYA